MTFLPRIMPAGGSAAEVSAHGHAHATWGHGTANGEATASEALETAPSSHQPVGAEQLEEAASADVPEVAHGATAKTPSGKRAARTRSDGSSPGFAAELAKNVLAADGPAHPDAALTDDEETSLTSPSDEPAQGSAMDAHSAVTGALFQRLAGTPAGHAGHAGEPSPLPDGAARTLPVTLSDGHSPPEAGLSSPVQAGGMPRDVVNGSSETPKSDAMSVSARVSTGSHARADGGGDPRVHASELAQAHLSAAVANGPAAPVLPAIGHASGEPQSGSASAPDDHASSTNPGARAGGDDEVASFEPEVRGPIPQTRAPGFDARLRRSLDAPARPAPATLRSPAEQAASSAAVPADGLATSETTRPTVPGDRPTPIRAGLSHGGEGAPLTAPPAHPLSPPASTGPVVAQPVVSSTSPSALPGPVAPAMARVAVVEPARVTPSPQPTPARSVARAGVAYAQVAADGEPAPRSPRHAPAAPTAPARLSPRAPRSTPVPAADDRAPLAASSARVLPPEADAAPRPRRQGAAAGVRSPDAAGLQTAVQPPPLAPPSAAAIPATGTPAGAAPVSRPHTAPVASSDRAGEQTASTPARPARHTTSTVIESGPGDRAGARAEDSLAHPAPIASAAVVEATPAGPAAAAPAPVAAPPLVPAHPSPVSSGNHPQMDAPRSEAAQASTPARPPLADMPRSSEAPGPGSRPRRDIADAPVQPSVPPVMHGASPPAAPSPGPIAPSASLSPAPRHASSYSTSPVTPSGSGVPATGESTAAHPTPFVDPSLANPPLFRLSDTRRVQAAHLDLAQQSYQPGTVATSSPSTNGFGTGPNGDKAERTKKARPANFEPVTTMPGTPVAPPAPLSPKADEPVTRRSAGAASRTARTDQPVDAIHALASAGPAAPLAAASLGGPAPHAPTVRHAAPAADRSGPASSRDVTAATARGDITDVDRDAKRAAPGAETSPDRREPTPVVAADKAAAPAPLAAHTPAASPSAPQTPATPGPGPQAPVAAQPLYDLATADHSLQATALGNNAHLHLDAGAAGPLSLHLSVRDGVADLEVEGPAAERLNLRPEELRRALAGEGLTLGHFVSRANEASDTRSQQDDGSARNGSGSGQSGDRGANTPDTAPRPTVTPFAAQSGASSYGGEGRRNWQGETPDPADRDRRPGAASATGATPPTAGDAPPARRRGVHVTA